MKHLLSIESLSIAEIEDFLQLGFQLKSLRGKLQHPTPLKGKTWALIFGKSSTRTRVSFEVGIRELGGQALFLGFQDIQLGRGETVEDTAHVMSRYVHGVVIRTYGQEEVEAFARVGSIPVINALTDDEHPCQILADLMTWAEKLLKESRKKPRQLMDLFQGKTLAFFGDAACNVAQSWVFAAGKLGFRLHLAAPPAYRPRREVLKRAGTAHILEFDDALQAARGADVLYTDTWISMGKELEGQERIRDLRPFAIQEPVVAAAVPRALVMHCLPAYRGKEISEGVFQDHSPTIFDQAENRLHIQKAILTRLA